MTQVPVVHPELPVKTVGRLVALVKARPGSYSIASPGIGTPGHLTLLHAEMAKAVLLPDVKERLNALGFEPFAPLLADAVVRIRTESKWAKLIRATGLKAG